jgi:hypothetical protein
MPIMSETTQSVRRIERPSPDLFQQYPKFLFRMKHSSDSVSFPHLQSDPMLLQSLILLFLLSILSLTLFWSVMSSERTPSKYLLALNDFSLLEGFDIIIIATSPVLGGSNEKNLRVRTAGILV